VFVHAEAHRLAPSARRVSEPDVDRREGLGLRHFQQMLARKFEQRDERDDYHLRAAMRIEQVLEHAAAADLVAGQASEGRPVVLVRGLTFVPDEDASARALVRPPEQDLYA
jgi:F420-0:gamma-glutamyl ligase